jgi:hypothetical protein
MLALAMVLGSTAPSLAQAPLRTEGGPTAQQGGPQGSDPAPIAPQLQAVQQAILNSDQQLSAARGGGQPPNFDQALRAVMGGQDTLAEMRSATGGQDNELLRTAERELAETRRLLESPNPDLPRVSNQLRQAANAITNLGSATGATTGGTAAPGQPAMGGGARR